MRIVIHEWTTCTHQSLQCVHRNNDQFDGQLQLTSIANKTDMIVVQYRVDLTSIKFGSISLFGEAMRDVIALRLLVCTTTVGLHQKERNAKTHLPTRAVDKAIQT